jgi:hypothetical protein
METNLVTDKSALTSTKKNGLQAIDLENGKLPLLADATVVPISLNFSYWTPENKGDSKRAFFLEVRPEKVQAVNADGETELDCAIFLEQLPDGTVQQIGNGSKRLVGPIMDAVDRGLIQKGVPLLITYLGKKKNKTNSFMSDDWSIKPLIINID